MYCLAQPLTEFAPVTKAVRSPVGDQLPRQLRDRFVALNRSTVAASLAESELFGYSKGAFTGAAAERVVLGLHDAFVPADP